MLYTKTEWIDKFRKYGDNVLRVLSKTNKNKNEKASEVNRQITTFRDEELSLIIETKEKEKWGSRRLINEVMLLTYVSYITMLEYRNKVWPYEYMTFSRRIGEFWEPFCKLPFEYPVKSLKLIDPPDFEEVQRNIKKDANDFIDSLALSDDIKEELKNQYAIPWTMVDSGGIKLDLDLHFEQNGIHYNCDFKSGFNSNEKGNTNRLLLVASIYKFIGDNEKTILFVRPNEDENNHYLQTLKNSTYWDVYCSDECYSAIKEFTDFDIRQWLNENADWEGDISDELHKHLEENDLLKYLTW